MYYHRISDDIFHGLGMQAKRIDTFIDPAWNGTPVIHPVA
jgi:hypothetical protein